MAGWEMFDADPQAAAPASAPAAPATAAPALATAPAASARAPAKPDPWGAFDAPAGQTQDPSAGQAGQPAPVAAPLAPADPDKQIGDIGRSIVQGGTFGFGDELAAGLDAASHGVLGFGSGAGDYNQRYAENLKAERARDKLIPPSISTIGGLVGGAGAMVAGSPVIGALGKAAQAAPVLGDVINGVSNAANAIRTLPGVQTAANVLARIPGSKYVLPALGLSAEGAGYGAVQGFGEGEGGFQNRLESAESGAKAGAVLGPALAGGVKVLGAGVGLARQGVNALSVLGDKYGVGARNAMTDAAGVPVTAGQYTPGQINEAAKQYQGATTDIPTALDAIDQHQQAPNLVPGDNPTTYQVTADQGQGSVERAQSQADNTQYIQRRDEQNAARTDKLDSLAPAGSQGSDVVTNLTDQQRALQANADASTAQAGKGTLNGDNAVPAGPAPADAAPAQPGAAPATPAADTSTPAASTPLPAIGGAADTVPVQAGAALRGAIDEARAPTVAEADAAVQRGQASAQNAVDAVGGRPSGDQATDMQNYGKDFRDSQAAADEDRKVNVSRLANKIDPNGTLNADISGLQSGTKALLKSMPEISGGVSDLGPDEAKIVQKILQAPKVVRYGDLAYLNEKITGLMREAKLDGTRGQELSRLTNMKGLINDAMVNTAAGPEVTMSQLASKPGDPIAAPSNDPAAPGVTAPTTGTKVYTPSGKSVDVAYRLHELDDLVASHDTQGDKNPDYPQDKQPRNRDKAASLIQTNGIGADIHPEEVGASASTATGAPMTAAPRADGKRVVLSGNGRTIGLQKMYEDGGAEADKYRAWLTSQGHDITGMKQPVVSREILNPMDDAQQVEFAKDAGSNPIMGTSAGEKAVSDSKGLSDDLIASYKGGDVTDPQNADFVRQFVQTLPKSEQNVMASTSNELTTEGAERIRNALMHYAYGDEGLTRAMTETIDPQAKVLSGALKDAAGPMARLKAGIQGGEVDPAVDISKSLVEATQLIQQAKSKGVSLTDRINQGGIFGDGVSPRAEALLKAAYGEKLSGRMSQEKMTDLLTEYAKEAEKQSTTANMFGANLTPDQILEQVSAKYGKDGQSDVTTGNAIRARSGDGFNGPETRGSGDASVGEGASATGSSGQNSTNSGTTGTSSVTGSDGSGPTYGNNKSILPETTKPKLTANFTSDDAANVQAMRAAHAERKSISSKQGVAEVLKPDSTANTYKLPVSEVPKQIFGSLSGAAERVQNAIRGGVTPAQIADYAAYDLRKNFPSGVPDAAGFAAWQQKNRPALQALTAADPSLTGRFDTIGQATQRLADLRDARAAIDKAHPLSPGWGDADVMPGVWKPGPQGAGSVQKAISGAGGSQVARDSLADYAAYTLRKEAAPNGVLKQSALDTWSKKYDGALSVMPEIKQRFQTLADAQTALDDSASQHKTALENFQNSVAQHFMDGGDSVARMGKILSSDTSQRDMIQLKGMVAGDPAAEAAMQRLAIDHITKIAGTTKLAGSSGTTQLSGAQFQKFVKAKSPALREILAPEQMDALHAMAHNMQRSDLSLSGNVLPGNSATAQNAAAIAKHGLGSTILQTVMQHGIETLIGGGSGGAIGGALFGPIGFAVGGTIGTIAGKVANSMHAGNINSVQSLIREATLHPEIAQVLLKHITPQNRQSVALALGSEVRRAAVATFAGGTQQQARQ